MVLWEITLATAYFLGLKRTYRLALKIQRRIISPKRLKLRHFLHRRTRAVFDVALKVHRNIQERDIEVGRNLGNWILRFLHRAKPSAQIRGPPPNKAPNGSSSSASMSKPSSSNIKSSRSVQTPRNTESDRHMFTSSRVSWPKPLRTIGMMMRTPRTAGTITQYRQISGSGVLIPNCPMGVSGGVIRKDIMEWMVRN